MQLSIRMVTLYSHDHVCMHTNIHTCMYTCAKFPRTWTVYCHKTITYTTGPGQCHLDYSFFGVAALVAVYVLIFVMRIWTLMS